MPIVEPKVEWFDDFLGIGINPTYAISLAGSGNVKISDGQNGIMALYCISSGAGTARIRLGEEPGNSLHNALNFSARKNLIYQARVFLNRNENIQATIGLTGLNDPHNVLALVYEHPATDSGWCFQAINEGLNATIPIDFIHTPGVYFTARIETGPDDARVFINQEPEPRVIISREYVPDGLCAEFQVWNRPLEAGLFSQPTMYVDYLSVEQDR